MATTRTNLAFGTFPRIAKDFCSHDESARPVMENDEAANLCSARERGRADFQEGRSFIKGVAAFRVDVIGRLRQLRNGLDQLR